MPSELQQNRYDQLIRRAGGIVGPGSKVSEALTELFPMIDVERVPGELLILAQTRLAFGSTNVPAVALNISRGQLFNPADSGVLVTCSQMIASRSTAGILRWGINEIELATNTGNNVFRDSRLDITGRATATVRNQSTNPSLAPINGQVQVLANTPLTIVDENTVAILDPGTGLQVSPADINTGLTVLFYWRERTALESELNF